MTSFVGRRKEVAQVRRMLGDARLVTLVGTGGVGKTRLALRVAGEVRRAFPDGVWLVELAALESPKLLAETVVDALGIHDRSARSAVEVLLGFLHDKRALVVLDNCEHLLRECAVIADAVLRAAPEVRIVATSRQPLVIDGERCLPVLPLPLPGDHDSAEALMRSDAVRLFAERAAAARPGFAVTAGDGEAVARICQRLDGIPLGIELAAVRLRSFSLKQLVDRLDDRFRLPAGGPQMALARHRTLRALIDWSYELCSAQERLLWARVSVFAGGLDLEAAEAVCVGEGIDRHDIFDLLAGLVDKSVLICEEHAGRARYRMLETIRQYGRDRLVESGEEQRLRYRHRDWFLRLAEHAEADWFGPHQRSWLARLAPEHPNFRTALDYCLTAPGQARAGLRIASALWIHWLNSSLLGEGRQWLDQALALDAEASTDRAKALRAHALLAVAQGDTETGTALLDQSRALLRERGDESGLMHTNGVEALAALFGDDLPRARARGEEMLARSRALGEVDELVMSGWTPLVLATGFLGETERAIELCQEGIALCRAHGENWSLTHLLQAYALVLRSQEPPNPERTRQAITSLQDALRIHRGLNDIFGVIPAIEYLGWSLIADGDGARGARLLGAAQRAWQDIGGYLWRSEYFIAQHDRYVTQARALLGEKTYDAEFHRGTGMTLEQAVAYAVKEPLSPGEGAERPEPEPLTRREAEVARLVAQGLSNKEIAARLVVASRTAEGHVERILAKLGFTSRTQIAVWVHAQEAEQSDRTV
ncbi:ATP-binding protein [Actinoallomurus sp. CA-150999]|uniref:ATP-binding protein n=1 Tax=Actinoallomurus sp. CA-150999 TaxID=3239887 RepID=UPI003D94FFFB